MNGIEMQSVDPDRGSGSAGKRAADRAVDSAQRAECAAVPARVASRRRIRDAALALTALALTFYFGFIAITIFRSHH